MAKEDWCKVSAVSGNSDSVIEVTVDPWTGNLDRKTTITVTAPRTGSSSKVSKTIEIAQPAKAIVEDGVITYSTGYDYIPVTGGEAEMSFKTNLKAFKIVGSVSNGTVDDSLKKTFNSIQMRGSNQTAAQKTINNGSGNDGTAFWGEGLQFTTNQNPGQAGAYNFIIKFVSNASQVAQDTDIVITLTRINGSVETWQDVKGVIRVKGSN